MTNLNVQNQARLATMPVLRETILPNFLSPVPSCDTLRVWFIKAKIPKFKINGAARKGGRPGFL